MLTSGQTTTPLQIIFKSMKVADDTLKRNSECEWVNIVIYSTGPDTKTSG